MLGRLGPARLLLLVWSLLVFEKRFDLDGKLAFMKTIQAGCHLLLEFPCHLRFWSAFLKVFFISLCHVFNGSTSICNRSEVPTTDYLLLD